MKRKSVLKKLTALTLSAAMIATLLPQQVVSVKAANEMPQKLAYFNFDNSITGSTVTADAGEGVTATVIGSGATINNDDKKIGAGALSLSDSSYLTISNAEGKNPLTGKSEITISYYSKPSSEGNSGWAYFASRGDEANTYRKEHYIGILDRVDSIEAQRWNNNGSRADTMRASSSSEWKLVTVVMNETMSTLYINGVEKAKLDNEPLLTDILGDASKLHLGKANWGAGEYYKGLIDEFTIYDGALTEAQVAAEYLKNATTAERISYLGILDENESLDKVTGNLNLATDVNGVTIDWTSSNESKISKAGVIGEKDGSTVQLTATATCDGTEVFKETYDATLAVAVTVKAVDAESNVIKTETVDCKAGESYTYIASEDAKVITTDSKVYVYDEENNKDLTIDSVSSSNNEITVKYNEAKITGITNPTDTYYAIEGNTPVLPKKLTASTEAGVDLQVEVTWDTSALKVGDNDVNGTAAGNTATVKVHVYKCDEEIEDKHAIDTVVYEFKKQYKGEIVAEYDIQTDGNVDDGAVLYMDSVPAAGNVWNNGGAMLHFKTSQGYFNSRLGDGTGGAAANYPNDLASATALYDGTSTYHVRVVMNSSVTPGNYHIYITDPDGNVNEITKTEGNGFRKYNEGIIKSWFAGRDTYKNNFTVKNHKISWVSGYATKVINYYIDDAETAEKTVTSKELPGTYTFEPEATYVKDGKTYYLNTSKSGWVGSDAEAAADETVTYNVYYESGSFEALTLAIQEAEASFAQAVKENCYTADSLQKLSDAITKAKAVEGSAAPSAIKTAIAELEEAVAAPLTAKSFDEINKELTAWYPLTDDASDATANGNDGVATDKVTFSRENGATFVGDGKLASYISLPATMFDKKDQLTVSFWAKDDGTDADRNQAAFGFGSGTNGDGDNSEDVFKYVLINTNAKSKLKAVITKNTWRGEIGYADANVDFAKNTWSHITCVFNGTKYAVYKDGVLVGEKDTGICISDLGTNRVAYIGNSIWGINDNDYIGSVKDFRIYNASLAAEQVKAVYDYAGTLPMKYAKSDLIEAMGATVEKDGTVTLNVTNLTTQNGVLTLPATSYQDATVVWTSGDDNIINATTGEAALPAVGEANKTVDLTAAITVNGKTENVVFKCTLFTRLDIDTTELEALISQADALAEADYTAESWSVLQTALTEAKKIVADKENASEETVKTAKEDLETAIAGLKAAEKEPAVYTVTFKNGTAVTTVKVTEGGKVKKPADPKKTGYKFGGWFAAGSTKAFDFNTVITGNVTLTAKWIKLTSISSATVKVAKAAYTGKVQKPKVTVTYKGKTLKLNTDYKVAYGSYKKVGKAQVKITGIGNYTGTKTVSYNIIPNKNKITKITNVKGKKLTVKFSKATSVKGYEISYATSSSFKGAKKVKTTKTSVTLKSLKKNKTYYVRVRSYTKIGTKTVYSDYSPVVKKKVTK